jgi:uncharacterized protein (TIGR02246 family)
MELANQDSITDHADRPVEELLSKIEAAWNRGDPHAYAALYVRNASYISRAGMLWHGRAEIEKHHAIAFAGALRNTRLSLKARRISFLTQVVALVHADVELNQPESEAHATRAITTFVVARVDEGWRICAAHTTEVTALRA